MNTSQGAVVIGLRRRGVDVLTVPESGTLGASDAEQLQRASDEERVIFTQDDDFRRLAAAGTDHAGIVYATQERAVGQIIRGLMVKYRDVILPMTVLRRFDAVAGGQQAGGPRQLRVPQPDPAAVPRRRSGRAP